MRSPRRAVLLSFLLALAAPARAADPAAATVPIEQRVVALVFSNSLAMWTGSGFAVGDGRWIVTNHHVATRRLGPDQYLTLHDATVLSPWTGQAHRARVVAVDQAADLAVLRLEDAALPSLPLAKADFLDRPPPVPRPSIQVFGFPSVGDRLGWESSTAAHRARTQRLEMSLRGDVPVLLLAPVPGPTKGWSGGPALWSTTGSVVGAFHALVSFPEAPDRWMPQAIAISHLRPFLTRGGIDPGTLDRGVVPEKQRPAGAEAAFRHLIRITSHTFANEWAAAEREARALVALRPGSPDAHRILGSTLIGAGKFEEALTSLEESLRLAPDSAATLYHRAAALRALRRRAEAESDARRAAELDPEDHESKLLLGGILVEAEKYGEARDVLRRAAGLAPHHPLIRWELGRALQRLGETEAGLAEAKAAVELTVESEPLRGMRLSYAWLLSRSGRMEEAEKELREAVRLDPEDAATHLAFASFLAEAGRKEEARREAEKALALKPDEDVRRAATALLMSLGPAASG
jgi:tetratricopeptide (TPR) repeat protein